MVDVKAQGPGWTHSLCNPSFRVWMYYHGFGVVRIIIIYHLGVQPWGLQSLISPSGARAGGRRITKNINSTIYGAVHMYMRRWYKILGLNWKA